MKKIWMIVFMVMVLSGCGKKNAPLEIHAIAAEYLHNCNVKNSSIVNMDFEEIKKYANAVPVTDWKYISDNIEGVLSAYYDFQEEDSLTIGDGDYVELEVKLLDSKQGVIKVEKGIGLLIGSGMFDGLFDKELVGRRLQDVCTIEVGKSILEFYRATDLAQIVVLPQRIRRCIPREETAEMLKDNEFEDMASFYSYLFGQKTGEYVLETNQGIEREFIKYAFTKTEFTIPAEDIKAYSTSILEEYMDQAEALGITLEEYYSNILMLEEDAFFAMCSQEGEYEIKKCFVIGALAKYLKIDVNEHVLTQYRQKKGILNYDTKFEFVLKYMCLQEQVYQKLVNRY